MDIFQNCSFFEHFYNFLHFWDFFIFLLIQPLGLWQKKWTLILILSSDQWLFPNVTCIIVVEWLIVVFHHIDLITWVQIDMRLDTKKITNSETEHPMTQMSMF